MKNTHKRSMVSGYGGLPFGVISECKVGNVGVLGVPSEIDKGSRIGASLAPDALRKMTQQLDTNLPANGRDLGNLDVSGDWSSSLMELISHLVNVNVIPIVIGGTSDVANVILQALPDLPVVASMPLARRDLVERTENTVWLGLNGEQPIEVWDQINSRNMVWSTARQLDEQQAISIKAPKSAILWIDMSVIDLGHAAGTIGLNPGGIKPETLVSVVGAMDCNWKSIVITGLAPTLDTRGLSELAAIETINQALSNG
ncbi:arginase family protein [Amylibacter sp.]|nr:arginase family protein [Amylibacter sp.]